MDHLDHAKQEGFRLDENSKFSLETARFDVGLR